MAILPVELQAMLAGSAGKVALIHRIQILHAAATACLFCLSNRLLRILLVCTVWLHKPRPHILHLAQKMYMYTEQSFLPPLSIRPKGPHLHGNVLRRRRTCLCILCLRYF